MLSLLSLLALSWAVIGPAEAQTVNGYSSAPFYVTTFDSAPTSQQLAQSQGGYQWLPQSSGRTGLAYLNRRNLNYIDVQTYPDNYNRRVTQFGGEVSVEMTVYHRDFFSWMRLFDFAIAPIDNNGVPNANPTDHRFVLQHGPNGATTYSYEIGQTGTGVIAVAAPSLEVTHGEFLHIVCTTELRPGQDPLTSLAGTSMIYINGRQVVNGTTFAPRNITRNINWIGKSSYWRNGDNYENMFLDTFAMYNNPLSPEAIYAHMKTSRPPQHELVFNKNPSSLTGATTTTFAWTASDGALNNGIVALNGNNQYIDMLTTTGSSSAGTAMINTWNGNNGGLNPGVSYTAIVRFGALTANAPIFDMKDSGSNRVRMYLNGAGNVVFSLNSLTITSTSVLITNQWYHIAASVSSAGNGTLYINNQASGTGSSSALTAATYNTAFLGRSTDATPVYLNALIDAVRFYDIALSAAEVRDLHLTITRGPDGRFDAPRVSPPSSAAPVVSYTFSKPPPAFGEAGMTNYTMLPSLLGRSGMAYFDGQNNAIQLKDHADDYGRLIPTQFGGAMAFETTFQLRDASNQATIFSFTGGRGQNDQNQYLQVTYWQDPTGINSLKIENFADRSANKVSTVFCSGCANGEWVHTVMTVEQVNFTHPTAQGAALTTFYVNGVLVGSASGWLPEVGYRPALWLGKSAWDSDQLLAGQIDSFFWYNVELSSEAVAAHYALPLPPIYELTFAVDPRIRANNQANAGFGWSFNATNDQTSPHKGNLVLTGNQFVDLAATSGANFIGFSYPTQQGTGRNTPGVDAAQANGWSMEVMFFPQSVASGVTIFEMGNSDGSNSVKLSFTAAGQLSFANGGTILSCGTVAVNTWVDIAVALALDGNNYEATCYQNGERVAPAITFPAIAYVTRSSSFLGKAISGSNTNLVGQIDGFRIMSYTITSEDAIQLFEAYSNIGRLADPPKYASGPLAAWSFDRAPLTPTDPSSSITYNYYNWQLQGSASMNTIHPNRTGLAVFDAQGLSYALREYVDLNFDMDSYGKVMPQVWGGSLSFEFWINMAAPLKPWERVFDCGDDDTANIGQGDAIGKWNIWVGVNGGTALTVLHYYAPSQWTQLDIAGAWRPGQWQHIVALIEVTGPTTAQIRVYVDGVLAGSLATQPPPVRMRRNCWAGRSNWNDASLNATIDSFYFYNYALAPSQIQQHMVLPNPAQFDAPFDTDPSLVPNPAYSWGNVVGADGIRRSQLIFNGINQYAYLEANSGNTSIGQNFPLLNSLPIGIGQEGFSVELSAAWNNLAVNSRVFDLGNARGVDSFAIGNRGNTVSLFINQGVTDSNDVIDLFTATQGVFYHMVIVGVPVFNSTTRMDYQIFHSGNLVASVSNRLQPQSLIRRRSFLARSNNPTDATYFTGAIDLLRYYSYALRPNYVSYLYQLQGTSGPYVAPGQTPVQPSSTAPARSSSSTAPTPTSAPRSSSSSPVVPPTLPPTNAVRSSSSSTGGDNQPQPSSSSTADGAVPDSSSSSSLGGGAIAGIVIGAVIGALLICCVLFFLCFSGGRSGKSVKLEDDVRNRDGDDSTYEGEATSNEVEMV